MQRRTEVLFLIIIILSLNVICGIHETQANEIILDLDKLGNLVPYEDTYLMMPYAEVLFEIVNTTYVTEYQISFNANYTIFNPNETINVLVGAPFHYVPQSILSEIVITANDSEVEVELIHVDEYDESPWIEYLGYDISRDFLVTNYTFMAHTATIFHYSFDYLVTQTESSWSYGGVCINYDVGTARAWEGNITETVEFAIYGQQPEMYWCGSHGTILRKEPSIIDIENGSSYTWNWDNERIQQDTIEISFPYYTTNSTSYVHLMIILSVLVVITGIFDKKKKKRKGIE